MNKTSAYMTEGPLLSKIILYAIPVVLTGVLQLLFNAADLVIVGRFCGSLSVAAVGATGSIINLIVNLFIGLSVGAGVMVAQGIGQGDGDTVHKTVHTAFPAALIGGIVMTGIGILGARTFLELMDTQADVIDKSTIYMQIYFAGMTSSMVYNFGASILRAAGDIKSPLVFLSIAGVLNVFLNVFFVVVFQMDVAGVALATALSQTLSAVLVVLALRHREDACRLYLGELKIYGKSLLRMMQIGVPAGLQGSLFSISNVLIQSSINSFSSVAMSGNAAAGNIEGFVYISMNSLQQTAINFVGQNYGAKKYKRIEKTALISLVAVTVVGVVMGTLGYTFSRPLLGIYITDSPEAIEVGVIRMSLVCLPYFLCGIMDVMTGVLRGMGASLMPMIISVLGVCVFRIVWIFTIFRLPDYHSLNTLYASYPISWAMTFLVELTVFIVLIRRVKKREAPLAPGMGARVHGA